MLLPTVPPMTDSTDVNVDIIVRYLHTLVEILSTVADTGWSVSNVVPDRQMDASLATLPEVRQVLSTLIQTLLAKGILLG
jgi:hypothetical protein